MNQPVSELHLQLALAALSPPDFQHEATPQEDTFSRLFITLSPEEAHKEAGYSPNTTAGALLLAAEPQIVERAAYYRQILAAKYDIRIERIYAEYAAAAFSDPADFFDQTGAPLPIEHVPPRSRAAVKEITTTRYPTGRVVTKLRLHDKMTALDALARIKGLFEKDNAQRATIQIDVKRKAKVYEAPAPSPGDTALAPEPVLTGDSEPEPRSLTTGPPHHAPPPRQPGFRGLVVRTPTGDSSTD